MSFLDRLQRRRGRTPVGQTDRVTMPAKRAGRWKWGRYPNESPLPPGAGAWVMQIEAELCQIDRRIRRGMELGTHACGGPGQRPTATVPTGRPGGRAWPVPRPA